MRQITDHSVSNISISRQFCKLYNANRCQTTPTALRLHPDPPNQQALRQRIHQATVQNQRILKIRVFPRRQPQPAPPANLHNLRPHLPRHIKVLVPSAPQPRLDHLFPGLLITAPAPLPLSLLLQNLLNILARFLHLLQTLLRQDHAVRLGEVQKACRGLQTKGSISEEARPGCEECPADQSGG